MPEQAIHFCVFAAFNIHLSCVNTYIWVWLVAFDIGCTRTGWTVERVCVCEAGLCAVHNRGGDNHVDDYWILFNKYARREKWPFGRQSCCLSKVMNMFCWTVANDQNNDRDGGGGGRGGGEKRFGFGSSQTLKFPFLFVFHEFHLLKIARISKRQTRRGMAWQRWRGSWITCRSDNTIFNHFTHLINCFINFINS